MDDKNEEFLRVTLEDAGRRQLIRESSSLRRRCSSSWRGRLIGRGSVVLVTFNSVEGYGGVHSVSVKWRSCSFSFPSGDVYIVYHSNVLRY